MTRHTLLALDPGECTGYSIWTYDIEGALKHVRHGQIKGGIRGFRAWWHRQEAGFCTQVVSEKFALNARARGPAGQAQPNVMPLLIEGILAEFWPDTHYQLNVRKRLAPDSLLKRVGWDWPGEQHARDSARHAIAFLADRGHRPTQELIWPDPDGKPKVHNHDIDPSCSERVLPNGQLRGACMEPGLAIAA